MNCVRIGIIGTGLIARYHADAIKGCGKDGCVTALCDLEEAKMKAFATDMEYPDAKQFKDYQELITSGLVDMVAVCTSNNAHKEITIFAAEHGIHILCEKPLGLNAAEVKMMAKACEEASVINLTGFTYRRIPAMDVIKKMIEIGELGHIYHYKGRFYADRLASPLHPLEWRHLEEYAGSGVLGDLASHTLDMALYLLSSQCRRVVDVYGDASIIYPYRRDSKTGEEVKVTTEEVCNVIAHFDNGCEMLLENSRYSPFEMEIHISGEKGAVKYNLSRYGEFQLMLYDSPADYFRTYRTIPVETPIRDGRTQPADRMTRQYIYFVDCIGRNEAAHPAIGETCYIQELLDEMKRSFQEKKRLTL